MAESAKQNSTLNWVARIAGVVISAIWMYDIISTIVEKGFEHLYHQTSTGVILFLLITSLSVGVLLAWRMPLSAGKFIAVLSVLLSLFVYFSDEGARLIAILYKGLPYFLVGLLFIQSQSTANGKKD
jgi:DNA integrity scanning protein DisA with diadenylate cyclase activity